VAYFGSGQSEASRAISPIEATMFLLTEDMLAVVEGHATGDYLRSAPPVSREVPIPRAAAGAILQKLSALVRANAGR